MAIKVLPAAMASDADRLMRFQREAEVLAALHHPNIAAIYGLEKTPDLTALVMELVEGNDLSEIIQLFYLTPTGTLMRTSVDRSVGGVIEFKTPAVLFQSPLSGANSVLDQYAVSNDGQRFLFIHPRPSSGARPPITVVVNWAAEISK